MSEELKKQYEEPEFEIIDIKDNLVQTGPFNGVLLGDIGDTQMSEENPFINI